MSLILRTINPPLLDKGGMAILQTATHPFLLSAVCIISLFQLFAIPLIHVLLKLKLDVHDIETYDPRNQFSIYQPIIQGALSIKMEALSAFNVGV